MGMLIAGNYRCVTKDGMRPIKEAVHATSRLRAPSTTGWSKLCVSLGARREGPGAVREYATAALSLRDAVLRGAGPGRRRAQHRARGPLVQAIGKRKGVQLARLDETVPLVDAQLEINRAAQKQAAPA